MLTWKDTSSYAQGDKVRETKSVRAEVGPLRVSIHRHIHYPGKWLLTIYGGWIDQRELKAESLDDAKTEALKIVKSEAANILAKLADV